MQYSVCFILNSMCVWVDMPQKNDIRISFFFLPPLTGIAVYNLLLNTVSCVIFFGLAITGHFCLQMWRPGVKTPLRELLRSEVPRKAVMSCQLLLLYSLIVERSVSHPVRLTACVPLVTLQCPVPVDAIVAAPAEEERRCGPAGCETILGRKRRESRSCVQKPGQPNVSESTPLWHPSTPSSPEDRVCHPLQIAFCLARLL